jgi:hypothetical protein
VHFTDEYYIDISTPTVRTYEQVFRLLSRSGTAGNSDVTVWLSEDLFLCNYDALDPAAANRSSSAFVLESICFFFLPGIDHVIGVYGTSPNSHSSEGRDNDNHSVGSRVASMDSFFCLVAMYDCGGFPVRMERARSFVGRFPISVSCLKKVVQDGRCQRVLNRQNLGLSTDQWDCILRCCGSPNVQLGFSGPDFAQNPEAICDPSLTREPLSRPDKRGRRAESFKERLRGLRKRRATKHIDHRTRAYS